MTMPTPPRRRWFQFGLRTMFVVVTVVAVWLGYQANWIRQRHSVFTPRQLSPDSDVWVTVARWPAMMEPVSAPGAIWIFGEHGEAALTVDFDIPSQSGDGRHGKGLTPEEAIEAERIHRLFPETKSFRSKSFYVR
jgi:hypothetical protein